MSGTALSAVNYHLIKACNDRCTFCFATFRDVRRHLPLAAASHVVELLADAGTQKLTFAGGEPTLHPHLPALIRLAKGRGMTTSVVTNGARLAWVLDAVGPALDWVALSVDSASESTQQTLGRGGGDHVARTRHLGDRVRAAGCRLKLNTVVTALNHDEDMADFVAELKPERWKVLQVLPVEGQNDGDVEPLLIDALRFEAFVDRHRRLESQGIVVVAEDNDSMTDSYAMVDPLGRFYGNSSGRLRVSDPIHEVGVATALAQTGFVPDRLVSRGGLYEWGSGPVLPVVA